MKFYEVMSQVVLTSHLVGFDLLCVTNKVWNAMTPQKQAAFQTAATAAIDWSTQEHSEERKGTGRLPQGAEARRLHARRQKAFREFAQKKYLTSDLAKAWVPGMVDKINAHVTSTRGAGAPAGRRRFLPAINPVAARHRRDHSRQDTQMACGGAPRTSAS